MSDNAALWAQLQEIHANEMEVLKLQKEQLAKEKETMGGVTADPSDIVEINAGGQAFIQCHRHTLCLAPDSMFSHLFSGRWDNSWAKDGQGRVFFDHDPELILWIVNYLRIKRIEDPSDPVEPPRIPEAKKAELFCLLRYFGLHSFFFPEGETTFIDCSTMEVVQNGSKIKVEKKTERELRLRYNSSGLAQYFVVCKPSITLGPTPCWWKVTINSLPGKWLFLGIIGNLTASQHSISDSTSYGWADSSEVYCKGQVNSNSGWFDFTSGECLYFRYCENKLSMFSDAKDRLFALEDIDLSTAYIHFNFYVPSTQLTLSHMTEAEQQTMMSKLRQN